MGTYCLQENVLTPLYMVHDDIKTHSRVYEYQPESKPTPRLSVPAPAALAATKHPCLPGINLHRLSLCSSVRFFYPITLPLACLHHVSRFVFATLALCLGLSLLLVFSHGIMAN